MLINPVRDGESKKEEHTKISKEHSFEYKTANDLFEIMAKNHPCVCNSDKSLSTQDLIIIYENMDVGTKLMTTANKKTTSNQYVETIVYNDEFESEGSDLSDICSKEDLRDVCLFNNERIDFINNVPSFDNSVCHKFGNTKLKPTDFVTDYDKHFLFKDLYIKEQLLKNMDIICSQNDINNSFIPSSLLDYICCKRLEDNYSFYMDNVIKYVNHTIDQLKRISNGDYLTDKAKEKWQEVNEFKAEFNKNIVLANSVSIPIHLVQGAKYFCKSTWDDIVHSEMDIRCLSRLLEKKIILEVPKLICDCYNLFSKHSNNSFVIKCLKKQKKYKSKDKTTAGSSDVIIEIKRAISKDVIEIINPTVIFKSIPPTQEPVSCFKPQLALTYEHAATTDLRIQNKYDEFNKGNICEYKEDPKKYVNERRETLSSGNNSSCSKAFTESANCNNALEEIYSQDNLTGEKYNLDATDELRCTVQRLSMQSPVPEESEEMSTKSKKSPTRIRIKSPYENQSFVVEEKRRKKLLEIRQRRERRKLAMTENSKVTKHKYCKNALMPQASSSVTKLSITNKSFYTSIYGQTANVDSKESKTNKKTNKSIFKSKDNANQIMSSFKSSSENNCSESSFIDHTDTDFTYVQLKQDYDDDFKDDLASSSNTIHDFNINLRTMQQLMNISVTDLSISDVSSNENNKVYDDSFTVSDKSKDKDIVSTLNIQKVPTNTPKLSSVSENADSKKLMSSVECRKSIDKLYDLMGKLGKTDCLENHSLKSKFTSISPDKFESIKTYKNAIIQQSDSETSIKYQLTPSTPSCISFTKDENHLLVTKKAQNKLGSPITEPKVVINTKPHTVNFDVKNIKKNYTVSDKKFADNPLKAISQLLHKFENVQKTRSEKPLNRKSESQSPVGKSAPQLNYRKVVRQGQNTKDINPSRISASRDEKLPRNNTKRDKVNLPHKNITTEEKSIVKATKNLNEIMDEVKELRGEAVRGPRQSRLNSLAQPKKSYVQAHNEEYQNKYGKGIVSDRLQKLATTAILPEKNIGSTSFRNKQRLGSEVNNLKQQIRYLKPLVEPAISRRSASHSPKQKNSPALKIETRAKPLDTSDAPETLKKMVAVESYVKNHFRRPPRVLEFSEPHNLLRWRAPVVPRDVDLASATPPIAEECISLENKVDLVIEEPLPAVIECNDPISKFGKKNINDNTGNNLTTRKILSGSDFPSDIFEDKNIITAVSNLPDCKIKKQTHTKFENRKDNKTIAHDLKSVNSINEIQKLENAIYRQITTGVFQNKLRIKNLTLTPKHSMQKALVLQSGDAGSLVVEKSTISQEHHTSKTRIVAEIKAVPVLSKAHIDLSFAKFPMQLTTVGYSFPELQLGNCDPKSKESSPVDLFQQATMDIKQCDPISSTIVQYFKREDTENVLNDSISTGIVNIKERNIVNKDSEERQYTCEKRKETRGDSNSRIVKSCEVKSTAISESNGDNNVELKLIDMSHCTEHDNEIAKINASSSIKTPSENIDNTTSLDILVTLLNEIRKITIYSANMPYNKFKGDDKKMREIVNVGTPRETSASYDPQSLASFSSVDNLRQLESDPSIYSFYLSSNDEEGESNIRMSKAKYSSRSARLKMKPLSIDKEVNVDLFKKKCVHVHTDVPSLISLNMNRNDNAADSAVDRQIDSFNQSMVSAVDFQLEYTTTSLKKNALVDISKSALKPHPTNVTDDKTESLKQIKQIISKSSKNANPFMNESTCRKKAIRSKDLDTDPVLKIKRDVLVTIYSVLVLTVFAALSFPEILNTV